MINNRVCFYIGQDRRKKGYTVSFQVTDCDGTVEVPPAVFPKFKNLVYAFIFCFGIMHTTFPKGDGFITSSDPAIKKEIEKLHNGEGEAYGQALVEQLIKHGYNRRSERGAIS